MPATTTTWGIDWQGEGKHVIQRQNLFVGSLFSRRQQQQQQLEGKGKKKKEKEGYKGVPSKKISCLLHFSYLLLTFLTSPSDFLPPPVSSWGMNASSSFKPFEPGSCSGFFPSFRPFSIAFLSMFSEKKTFRLVLLYLNPAPDDEVKGKGKRKRREEKREMCLSLKLCWFCFVLSPDNDFFPSLPLSSKCMTEIVLHN